MTDYLGDGPDMHGTPRVDILRDEQPLSRELHHGLKLWRVANWLPDNHAWPLRVDFAARALTYSTVDQPAGERPFTQTLLQLPPGRLWSTLAGAGALWCADPAHEDEVTDPAGPRTRQCPHLVDRAGVHFPPGVMPVGAVVRALGVSPDAYAQAASAAANQAVEFALTIVIERAAAACEHTDPAGPIYDSTRACTGCVVTALVAFMNGPDPDDLAVRDRLLAAAGAGPVRAERWVVGHGAVPVGDPRATEWARRMF